MKFFEHLRYQNCLKNLSLFAHFSISWFDVLCIHLQCKTLELAPKFFRFYFFLHEAR